jgi:hypothetical protein
MERESKFRIKADAVSRNFTTATSRFNMDGTFELGAARAKNTMKKSPSNPPEQAVQSKSNQLTREASAAFDCADYSGSLTGLDTSVSIFAQRVINPANTMPYKTLPSRAFPWQGLR